MLKQAIASYPATTALSRQATITSARVDPRRPPAIFRPLRRTGPFGPRPKAPVAELVDALDSKSSSARSAGSIPARGTTLRPRGLRGEAPQNHEASHLLHGRQATLSIPHINRALARRRSWDAPHYCVETYYPAASRVDLHSYLWGKSRAPGGVSPSFNVNF